MKCLLLVLLLCVSCHSVVSGKSSGNKTATRTSRRLSASKKTSTTTVPSFTVEDFSRYVDSKGDSETVVLDISEVTESTASSANDSSIEYYDDYYYADDTNEINTSQRPNDKNVSTTDRSNKNVEREAHGHDGNYAYYTPNYNEWHPVAPPLPVLAPLPVIVPRPVHHHPPPIIVHPAPPTTTEDSHILHYTINYQVNIVT